jgi:hypothetical protein
MTHAATPDAPPGPDTAAVPDRPSAAIINATVTRGGARYIQHLADPGETARMLVEYVRTTTPAAAAAALTTEHLGGWREITEPVAGFGSCFCHEADGAWNPAFVDQVLITNPDHRPTPPHYGGYRAATLEFGHSVDYAYQIEDDGLHVYAFDGGKGTRFGTTLRLAASLAWHQPVEPDTVTDACQRLRQRHPRTGENELAGLSLDKTIYTLRAVPSSTDDLVLYLVTDTIRDKTSIQTVRRALAKATGTTQARLPSHLAALTRAEQIDLLVTVRRTLTATLQPRPELPTHPAPATDTTT